MYFSFLKDKVIDWEVDDKKAFNWDNVSDKFLRVRTLSEKEIIFQEQRLAALGYNFPTELKAFWTELGCGYLCSNGNVDNGLESPNTALDMYFNEGDWKNVHLSCDLLVENELPFFLALGLDYITIGLQSDVNLGKIYYCGIEIAPSLTDFIRHLMADESYYKQLLTAI